MKEARSGLPTVAGTGNLPSPSRDVRGVLPQATGLEADLPAPAIAMPLMGIALAGCGNPAVSANPSESPVSPTQQPASPTAILRPTEAAPVATVAANPTAAPTAEAPKATEVPKITVAGVGEVTAQEAELFNQRLGDYRGAYFMKPDQAVTLKVGTIKGTNIEVVTTDTGIPIMIKGENGVWRVPGYKDVEPSGFTSGTEVDSWTGYIGDKRYIDTFMNNFDMATPGGYLDSDLYKNIPQGKKLTPDEVIKAYNWKQFDQVMPFVKDSQKQMMLMHLFPGFLFTHANTPEWMKQMSDAELTEWQVKHMQSMADHFKQYGVNPKAISVVNELAWHAADKNKPEQVWLEGNYLYARLKDQFLKTSFETAKKLWPDAVLLMNDDQAVDGVQTNTPFNSEALVELQLIQRLKSQGVPIDGFGMQGHLLARNFVQGTGTPEQNIETNIATYQKQLTDLIQQYKAAGVQFYITELDINIGGLPDSWSAQQKEAFKARLYAMVYKTALDSKWCNVVNTWGFTNASTWVLQGGGYPYGPAESPLPYDKNFKPTQSSFEVLKVLLEERNK